MSFQIYERERHQGLNLLERMENHVLFLLESPANEDGEWTETANTIFQLVNHLQTNMVSEMDNKTMSFRNLADTLRNLQLSNRKQMTTEEVARWFARWISNYNVDEYDFLYAAGFALRPDDELLREEEEWYPAQQL